MDHVKGIQCKLLFFTRDVRKILNSGFVSKISAFLFLLLKTKICYIVNRDWEQKQWTKIALISIDAHVTDFRSSCKSVGAQHW